MKDLLFSTLKGYKKEYLPKDIFSGIIMAAVSIPISMGYAQIAGLPAVYGLYGSVFPILFFALFSTSRQFIFGVDAAPAAIVGAALVSLGIENGSKEAIQYVPVIALLTGIWLLLFYFLKAPSITDNQLISLPVCAICLISSGSSPDPAFPPNIFGICIKMIVSAIPLINPPITGVDIKSTILPAFKK